MIEKFLNENSLHDSYIVNTQFDIKTRRLTLNLVQLYQELNIENTLQENVQAEDLVEVEISFIGVIYVCKEIDSFVDYEIYSLEYGKINNFDILLFMLINDKDYREVYVRGENITIETKIKKIVKRGRYERDFSR